MGVPTPKTDREGRKLFSREDPFNCATWCGNGTTLEPGAQSSRLCTLQGFHRKWDDEVEPRAVHRLTMWMGRQPIPDVFRPGEELEEGCPGGWSRCRFATSFTKYMRRSLQSGGHDNNPRVHMDTPGHILDALSEYERQYACAEADFQRQIR